MKIGPREDKRLIPEPPELRRKYAEELDFIVRFLDSLREAPADYLSGEDVDDFVALYDANRSELIRMRDALLEPGVQLQTQNDTLGKERLLGASGEAKTGFWRRHRDRVLRFLFGGASKEKILVGIAEYFDLSKTIVESLETALGPYGKAASELLGLIKQLFTLAAGREAEKSVNR